jgi:hypothetical protein
MPASRASSAATRGAISPPSLWPARKTRAGSTSGRTRSQATTARTSPARSARGGAGGRAHRRAHAAVVEAEHGHAAPPERVGELAERRVAGEAEDRAVAVLRPAAADRHDDGDPAGHVRGARERAGERDARRAAGHAHLLGRVRGAWWRGVARRRAPVCGGRQLVGDREAHALRRHLGAEQAAVRRGGGAQHDAADRDDERVGADRRDARLEAPPAS